jgi:hypothetical protein
METFLSLRNKEEIDLKLDLLTNLIVIGDSN